MQIKGIHHITAVSAHIAGNLEFYTRTLGLRLVKKSVNQDDVSAYHLFYADRLGSPGTDMTFFDWPRVGPSIPGADTIAGTAFRVSGRDALEFWRERLSEKGVAAVRRASFAGRELLSFQDPEGQRLYLVDDENAPFEGEIWQRPDIPDDYALRGFYSTVLSVRSFADLAPTLTGALKFEEVERATWIDGETAAIVYRTHHDGGPGSELWLLEQLKMHRGRSGRRRRPSRRLSGAGCQRRVGLALATASGRLAGHRRHRPLLVPLDLLSGHQQYSVRDCHRRTGIWDRRDVRGVGRETGAAAVPGTPPQSHRARAGPHRSGGRMIAPVQTGQPVLQIGAAIEEGSRAVVLLHGRGASAEMMRPLAVSIDVGDYCILIPQAPQKRWYPYSAFGPIDRNEPDLSLALARIGRMIDELHAERNTRAKIVLGGFSQGACLASEYLARNAGRYGGLFVLSGALHRPPGNAAGLCRLPRRHAGFHRQQRRGPLGVVRPGGGHRSRPGADGRGGRFPHLPRHAPHGSPGRDRGGARPVGDRLAAGAGDKGTSANAGRPPAPLPADRR